MDIKWTYIFAESLCLTKNLKKLTVDVSGDSSILYTDCGRPGIKSVLDVSPNYGALTDTLVSEQEDFKYVVCHIVVISVCHTLCKLA